MKTFLNKFRSVLGIVALCIAISACDGLLNVNPVTQVDASTDLKDALSVRIALNGAYDGLSNRYIWGGEAWCYSDLMGEENDIRFRGTFQYMGDVWRRTMNSQSNASQEVWLTGYTAINRVNRILQVIDTLPASERNTRRGEALFIRGAVYFELIKLFGKAWGDGDNAANPGVPLLLTPAQIFQTGTLTDTDKPRRNTVAEVYAQIIQDLTNAETQLPTTSEPTRANKATAAALLSRVYLLQSNFAAARDAANRVIQTNRYSLSPTFTDAFREATAGYTAETIFRVPVSEQDGINQLNVFYSAVPGGRRDMEILASHLPKYETADARRAFFFTSSGRRLTSKWIEQFGDIPYFRIAEMYLTRAECNKRLGTEVGATPAADVNRIRQRVGLQALAEADVTVEAILKERRNELAFEGHWLHDKRRIKSNIVSASTYPYNSNALVFPVPNREIIANTNLTQNPGYTD